MLCGGICQRRFLRCACSMKIKLVILFFYNLTIEYNQNSLYNPVKRKKQGENPWTEKQENW